MINSFLPLKHLISAGRRQRAFIHLPRMAPVGWEYISDDDPWRVSAFVSAVMELFLSILMLLGASISFITFQLVKFFGLEPPCAYIGCVHRTYLGSRRGLVRYPSWNYAKLPSEDHSASNRYRYIQNYHHTSERDYMSMDDSSTESEMDTSEQFHLGHDNAFDDEERLALCNHQDSTIYKCTNQYRSDGEMFFDEDTVPLFSARPLSNNSLTAVNSDLCSISVNASHPPSVDIAYNETMSHDGEVWDLERKVDTSKTIIHDVAEPPLQKLPVSSITASEQSESKVSENGEINEDKCQELHLQEAEISTQILLSEEANTSSEEEDNIDDYQISNGVSRTVEDDAAEQNAFELVGLSIQSARYAQFPNMNEETSSSLLDMGTRDSALQCDREEGQQVHSQFTSESDNLLHEDISDEPQGDLVCSVGLVFVEEGTDKSDGTEGFSDVLHDQCSSQTGNTVQQELKEVHNPEHFNQKQTSLSYIVCPIQGSNDVGTDQTIDVEDNGGEDLKKHTILSTDSQNHLDLMSKITTEIVSSEDQKHKDFLLESSVISESDVHPIHEKPGFEDQNDLFSKSEIVEDQLCNEYSVVDVDQNILERSINTETFSISKDEEHEVSESEQSQEESLEALKAALKEERKLLAALEQELENERNAAAVATSEAMAMISRLQEEKAAMQMEVQQLQRMSEEKADYDEQAMTLLKEILLKREKEKFALEREVEMYREKLLAEQVEKLKRTKSMKENANINLSCNSNFDDCNSESQIGSSCLQFQAKEDQQIIPGKPHEEKQCTETSQESKAQREFGRSIFCTDDEETQFILERLWVLEEELQQLRAKDELVTQNCCNSLNTGASRAHMDSFSPQQHLDSDKSTRQKDNKSECDVAAGACVPVHDVYEVQCAPKPLPRCPEDSETLDDSEIMQTNCDSTPSTNVLECGMGARLKPIPPPRLPLVRRLFPVKEKHSDVDDLSSQENSWTVESHPSEDIWKHSPQRIVIDEVHQLTARLEALEADRELLRETLHSFKHREAEIHLLQEIAQHLRELRMAGYKVSDGTTHQSEISSLSDQSYKHTLKKRRYCNSSVTPLPQQKNI